MKPLSSLPDAQSAQPNTDAGNGACTSGCAAFAPGQDAPQTSVAGQGDRRSEPDSGAEPTPDTLPGEEAALLLSAPRYNTAALPDAPAQGYPSAHTAPLQAPEQTSAHTAPLQAPGQTVWSAANCERQADGGFGSAAVASEGVQPGGFGGAAAVAPAGAFAAPQAGTSDAAAQVRATPAYAIPTTLPPTPYCCDTTDTLFALLFSVFGYYYVFVLTKFQAFAGWYTFAVILSFVACTLGYLYAHGKRPAARSWFWLGVLLCTGLPLGFWSVSLAEQHLLVHGVALYWVLSATGTLLGGDKTGDWLPCDCINAFVLVPWGNLPAHWKSLRFGTKNSRLAHRMALVLLGLVLAVPLLGIVLPLLAGADDAFSALLSDGWQWLIDNTGLTLLRVVLSIPVTALAFGLCFGAVHRRRTNLMNTAALNTGREHLRFLPGTVSLTALGAVCAAYVLFISLQGSYLFSAFAGHLPASFSYSGYARQGFFELCRIGAINLMLLLAINVVSRRPRHQNAALRAANVVLCALSLLLVATAVSKMALYIAAYGLTVKRVLASTGLVWMALVFTALIVWQFRAFSPVRFGALAGAVLVCALCVCNVEAGIDSYNSAHGYVGTAATSTSDTAVPERGADAMRGVVFP